jgi:thioredoxin reductase
MASEIRARNCQSVNPDQETSVLNLYAADNLLVELDQISGSIGQAAIEAAANHNLLRGAA